MVKNIAIFASGTGSNAREIIAHFKEDQGINIGLIVSNKATAKVLDLAKANHIPSKLIERHAFYHTEELLRELHQKKIDFIALAGFLWLIPAYLIEAYQGQMVNIHPALLPKYGGKGMYGHHVHQAVKAAGETESGMTIHYVNNNYDEGHIIFQARCVLTPSDSASDIAAKVLQLEHAHYAKIIRQLLSQ